jgi:hypothetical protein
VAYVQSALFSGTPVSDPSHTNHCPTGWDVSKRFNSMNCNFQRGDTNISNNAVECTSPTSYKLSSGPTSTTYSLKCSFGLISPSSSGVYDVIVLYPIDSGAAAVYSALTPTGFSRAEFSRWGSRREADSTGPALGSPLNFVDEKSSARMLAESLRNRKKAPREGDLARRTTRFALPT